MASPSRTELVKSSDGSIIYAAAYGKSTNPSIVMLHGLGLCSDVFKDFISDSRLKDNFYVVTYDMRGHGRSAMSLDPEAYASKLFADDFAAVSSTFGLNRPVLLGWSLGAAVATDVCANISPNPLAGLVYIAPLPYIGPIMGKIGLPTIGRLKPGLVASDNTDLSRKTSIEFVESLFTQPDKVPFELKCTWMGMATLQPTAVVKLVLTRSQDPTKLFEEGKKGLPVLMLSGTEDTQVSGKAVVEEMSPSFNNWEANFVQGGPHALFYEKKDEVVEALVKFRKSVN